MAESFVVEMKDVGTFSADFPLVIRFPGGSLVIHFIDEYARKIRLEHAEKEVKGKLAMVEAEKEKEAKIQAEKDVSYLE